MEKTCPTIRGRSFFCRRTKNAPPAGDAFCTFHNPERKITVWRTGKPFLLFSDRTCGVPFPEDRGSAGRLSSAGDGSQRPLSAGHGQYHDGLHQPGLRCRRQQRWPVHHICPGFQWCPAAAEQPVPGSSGRNIHSVHGRLQRSCLRPEQGEHGQQSFCG